MTLLAVLMLVPVFAGMVFWYTAWAERSMLQDPRERARLERATSARS